ncbi:hypothetical protein OPKNFCMD_0963 [Methylobacterium crusticola]|uniref:Fungal lipase-like domain-containing protein n=1 Tax=Methylobacterium crusticola TaxID=1697972 RepID=A0ABQ4QU90_9HYPH|nr:hypothetical protein [Methylobacterium crusticola]GJD48246.1 hypothetical protein OPKNFCMD_0963 [Methylobacterium crusticola]
MAESMLQQYYDVSHWMYGRPDSDLPLPIPDNLSLYSYQGITLDSGLLSSGFHGTAFVTNDADPRIIIGFEGTDTAGARERPLFLLAQIEADLALYRGLVPQALRDAGTFTAQVLAATDAQHIARDHVTVTGHSLGAGEAAYVAARENLGGTTFAAPGLPPGAVPAAASPEDLTNYVEFGDPVANYSATPVNYEGAFLFEDGIARYGDPTYVGVDSEKDLLRGALGAAGAQFEPGTTVAQRAAGLAAFGALAAEYHPLTTYGGDLDLASSVPEADASRIIGGDDYRLLLGDLADGSFLVKDAYYAITNPDVRAAGIDAETHYDAFGWREGRDPNAVFSTTGYLAANPHVAASGINPLTQFDQGGWREGRDPGAGFDAELYLARNPDVQAAGVDPLAHYLAFGQAEGREAYAAVGRAGDLTAHPGFDAEYYLLANPDVARAAREAGAGAFELAYRHYATLGWREGRDPNAAFDTRGYLAAYADVAAAGIDPLLHYDQFGWRENRDPSRQLDTSAYLAANPDVAGAGIDPMLHYLQFGAREGRASLDDGAFDPPGRA